MKKNPETDAIFENVLKENKASDRDVKSLRISIDTKAKVKIGGVAESRYECSRNGNIVKLQVMY